MNFNKYLSIRYILTFSGLNYFQAALSFGTSLLLARMLGSELYGYYSFGLVFNTTLFILVQFGMDKTLVRDLVQGKRVEHLLWAATYFKIALSALGLGVVAFWAFGVSNASADKVYIALLFALSGCIYGISPRAWFDYTGQIKYHAILMLLERLLFAIGAVILLFYYNQPEIIIHVALVLLGGRVVMSLLEWRYVFQTLRPVKIRALRYTLTQLAFKNVWVWMAAVSNLFMTHVNQFLLDMHMGTTQLGYYGLAFQLIMLVQLVQSQVLRLATPSIAETVKTATRMVVLRKYRWDILLCLTMTNIILIPVYWVSPWLIDFLVGAEYAGALPIFRVLCFWSLVYGVALINNQYLLSYHLQKPYFYTTLIFGCMSLIMAYHFIQMFGGVGAALSLLLAHAGSVAVQSILVIFQIHQHENIAKKPKSKLVPKETTIKITQTIV